MAHQVLGRGSAQAAHPRRTRSGSGVIATGGSRRIGAQTEGEQNEYATVKPDTTSDPGIICPRYH
jgi:hypothetical protein